MSEPERRLTPEDMSKLEQRMPSNDRLPNKLGVPSHYGSIEEAEERRFPWLKARRRSRRRP